ncbi:ParA family protein [Vibrio furnissii]|uniref:ParA family protein n=1 Tax=Vibrio furnissii TaxID=29494 RepID=UPI001C9CADDA|nr:ParA family protein [Vibrio furnissii]MBY7933090.1 ParA family protein [Vibrio fluvialis]MCG6268451.1 ParA family protein [Vibrio furnissii]
MKKVIAVVSSKGGTGKSMTAVNFAIDAANRKFKTLLVDAEKHGTTIDLEPRSSEYLTVMNGYDKAFPKMLDIYRNSFDLIIIDTAGVNADINGDNENLQEVLNDKIIAKSDLLLIPIEPSPVSVRKSIRFFDCVERYLEHARGALDAFVFVNKAVKSSIYTRELKKDLPSISIDVAKTSISDLIAIKKAEEHLMSVNEFDSKSDAALQMRLLQKEVFNRLGMEWSN